MIKVGITGGIASGKSTCAMHLMMKGYEIYSADSINHDLLKNDAKGDVIDLFGTSILDPEGEIDRRKLAKIVFSNDEALLALDTIIHPLVRKKIESIISSYKGDIIFFEIPLLFESHMADLFDYTINIYTNEDVQIERVMMRDSSSRDEALARIKKQMSTEDKNKKASFAIASLTKEQMLSDLDNVVKGILK